MRRIDPVVETMLEARAAVCDAFDEPAPLFGLFPPSSSRAARALRAVGLAVLVAHGRFNHALWLTSSDEERAFALEEVS